MDKDFYEIYFLDDKDMKSMTAEKIAAIKHEVPVSICEDLTIPLEFVSS